MKKLMIVIFLCLLAACGKVGVSGHVAQTFGNWAEVNLPPGCKVKQISSSSILCEDGRVFH